MALATILAIMIIFALGAGATVSAQTAQVKKSKTRKSKSAGNAEAGASAAGQQAAIDPQTGKLREPTREEAEKMAEEMEKKFKRSPEKLTTTQLSDGTLIVELTEEYMDVSVVRINSDGSLTVSCVKGMDAADALVKAEAKTSGDAANNADTVRSDKSTTAASATNKGKTGKATRRPVRRSNAKDVKAPATGRKE